jgi:hypothetical protein
MTKLKVEPSPTLKIDLKVCSSREEKKDPVSDMLQ